MKLELDSREYQSPRWTAEVADCSMPMTFDTYSVCSFGCVYCFSQFQRAIGGAKESYASKKVAAVRPERIKRIFTDPDSSQFGPYVAARRVMQWGGLSDPFDLFEREFGVGLELMRFFRDIEYPISFSTKGTWFLDDPRYRELIEGASFWHFKVSVITLEEKAAQLIERGVPSPAKRLEAIGKLAELGVGGVTLRFRPFIVGVSDPRHVELVEKAAAAGADSVSTEFLCVETRSRWARERSYPVMSRFAGFDVYDFYRQYSAGSGYLRLNRGIKEPYVDALEEACERLGLRLYVSDADFKERSCNSSCCGLGSGWNYSRGQFTKALLIARERGSVRWADIAGDMEHLLFPWDKATQFNTNSAENRAKWEGQSMRDYLRYLWNHPKDAKSPYRYFRGALVPERVDDEGDVVYRWNPEVTGREAGA